MKGLETKQLNVFKDERGYMISLRANEEIFNGKFGQCLLSVIYPGIIKGLHLHKKQTDFCVCVKGHAKYVATDGKEFESFIIGESNPLLVKVSPGIWHGYMALDNETIIMHTMDTYYDSKDTEKIDPFSFGDLWGNNTLN